MSIELTEALAEYWSAKVDARVPSGRTKRQREALGVR
jgi:hypothetical protein